MALTSCRAFESFSRLVLLPTQPSVMLVTWFPGDSVLLDTRGTCHVRPGNGEGFLPQRVSR